MGPFKNLFLGGLIKNDDEEFWFFVWFWDFASWIIKVFVFFTSYLLLHYLVGQRWPSNLPHTQVDAKTKICHSVHNKRGTQHHVSIGIFYFPCGNGYKSCQVSFSPSLIASKKDFTSALNQIPTWSFFLCLPSSSGSCIEDFMLVDSIQILSFKMGSQIQW